MWADFGARCGGTTVETNACAAWGPIGGDLACVWPETGRWIFGSDAALNGKAMPSQCCLIETEFGECLTTGDSHLRLHQIDIGNLFCHSVLNLNAWVHLNEDVLAGVGANSVNQKFDGARVFIANLFCKRNGILVKLSPQLFGDVWRRGYLDNLLVSALHRAVALKKVHYVAMLVGKYLHFDVTRAQHCLL